MKDHVHYTHLTFEELGDTSYGDPHTHGQPTEAAAPWRHERSIHVAQAVQNEAVVGRVFVFGDRSMALTAKKHSRAVLVQNSVTERHRWVPRQNILTFFTDQLPIFRVEATWNQSEKQPRGGVAEILERNTSKGLHYDTNERIKQHGGNPQYRSEFKFPHRAKRVGH